MIRYLALSTQIKNVYGCRYRLRERKKAYSIVSFFKVDLTNYFTAEKVIASAKRGGLGAERRVAREVNRS
jgi:hypothetical protein